MNKTIVVIGLMVSLNIHAYGQGIGIFEMSNVATSPDRQIYLDHFLTGPKPEGDAYKIAIFWGPEGTIDENALIQVGNPTGFIIGAGGQFSDGLRTIVDPGATIDGPVAAFQARAWDVSSGATWAAAVANPDGRTGKGPIFEMRTKDPFDLTVPDVP